MNETPDGKGINRADVERERQRDQERRSPTDMIQNRLNALQFAREMAAQHPDDPSFLNLLKVMEDVAAEEGLIPDSLPPQEE